MTPAPRILARGFYDRPSQEVARELLGCWLVRRVPGGLAWAQIVETEAYLGEDDPASHAHRGPTRRNLPMYGPPGFAYVYFIYGIHHCLNVVTGPEGIAEAVLIRGAVAGTTCPDRMDGPGRLCRALGVDLSLNRADLCSEGRLWLESGTAPGPVIVGPRVGVRDPAELRFRIAPPLAARGLRTSRTTSRT